MRWYGSLNNRFAEHCKQPEPEVGMGVTAMYWSDREPYEIVAVKDARHIEVRRLDYKRIDNNGAYSECQEYEYISNPDYHTIPLFKTQKGQWRERIGKNGLGDLIYVVGYAERYYDYTF